MDTNDSTDRHAERDGPREQGIAFRDSILYAYFVKFAATLPVETRKRESRNLIHELTAAQQERIRDDWRARQRALIRRVLEEEAREAALRMTLETLERIKRMSLLK